MNIKEIEGASGMARASIRFYEKEGLLAPTRRENGYRDYSSRDLEELKKIRLLRELGLTLEQIKEAQAAPERLPALLDECKRAAEQEMGARRQAVIVCGEICDRELSYRSLSPQIYLERLYKLREDEDTGRQRTERQRTEQQGMKQQNAERTKREGRQERAQIEQERRQESIWMDAESLVLHPWRRFFARSADLLLCRLCVTLLWNGALGMPFSMDIFSNLRWAWAGLVLMLLTEPLFLTAFGTTPGKWLFGIRVHGEDGGKLTYREAFRRTWQVIRQGLGFCVPFLEWYCLYQGWMGYTAEGRVEWDDGTDYQVKEREDWLSWLAAFAVIVFCLSGVYLTVMGRMLPPNRGELTVAEFAENYNYYVRMAARRNGTYDERILAGLMLGEDGQFSLRYDSDDGNLSYSAGVAVQTSKEPNVEFVYLLEQETVRGISFVQSIQAPGTPSGYVDEMQCAALAYLAADGRVVGWNGSLGRLMDTLESRIKAFQSYDFEENESRVSCQVELGAEGFVIQFSIQ